MARPVTAKNAPPGTKHHDEEPLAATQHVARQPRAAAAGPPRHRPGGRGGHTGAISTLARYLISTQARYLISTVARYLGTSINIYLYL